MLQGRLFSYADTQRYRLGVNHTALPVNCPHATKARTYSRDGAMRFDSNGAGEKNYEPNSFGGPAQSNEPHNAPLAMHGVTGPSPYVRHTEDDDFTQAGDLYRLMSEEEKVRLVENIAGSLSAVTRDDIIARSIGYFRSADPGYGARLAAAVGALRAENVGDDITIQVGDA